MAEATVKIDGMSCGHCVNRVKQAVDGLDGVKESKVEIGTADVKFDETALNLADIESAIEKSGYRIKR